MYDWQFEETKETPQGLFKVEDHPDDEMTQPTVVIPPELLVPYREEFTDSELILEPLEETPAVLQKIDHESRCLVCGSDVQKNAHIILDSDPLCLNLVIHPTCATEMVRRLQEDIDTFRRLAKAKAEISSGANVRFGVY